MNTAKTLLVSAAAALLLAACGDDKKAQAPAPAPAPAPTAPQPTAAQTAGAAASAAAQAAAAKAAATQTANTPVTQFKAYGFSPAWQANIKGDKLTYEVPETTGVDKPLRTITVTRSAYAKGVNYDGQDGKVKITVDIKSGPCDIATEGKPREFFATLTYGKATYKGCADGVR